MPYPTAVGRDIEAPAHDVFALVSDLTRMGEGSPENAGGTWIKGSTGPALGAVFQGTNRNGTPATITLLVTVDASGNVEYVTSGELTCVTAKALNLTAAGRFTVYDNGDFAFAMSATQNASGTGKGILIQPLKNITGVRVEKLGGCL